MNIPNKKKNQHYVWQHYLKSWESDREQVYCLRNNQIFLTATRNIGSQNTFYKTPQLTANELFLIETLITSQAAIHLQKLHRNFLKMISLPYILASSLELKPESSDRISKLLSLWEVNSIEDFHSTIENDSVRFLSNLRSGHSLFYDDKTSRDEFLFFLSLQYMRTKKIKCNVLTGFDNRKELRDTMDRIWSVISVLFAMNVADGMIRDSSRLICLENHTNVPFITGDQPVVNILANQIDKNPNATDMELYYPISSKLAVLVTDVKRPEEKIVIETESQIALYNDFIFTNCHEQIYSISREALEIFRG